ncbi:hypothetical protein [Emticicia sp. W12TSBA100-4]|uniref:hypothetical protein n=1 Tax=Emticicia sp. W12TSBA100-4 TaxID=3160965 RepID=UPI0033057CB2
MKNENNLIELSAFGGTIRLAGVPAFALTVVICLAFAVAAYKFISSKSFLNLTA